MLEVAELEIDGAKRERAERKKKAEKEGIETVEGDLADFAAADEDSNE